MDWTDLGALAAAVLAYLFLRGGFVLPENLAAVQVGAIVGIVAAFAGRTAARSALAAGVGVLAVSLLMPISGLGLLAGSLLVAAVTGAVAFGARWVVDAGHLRKQLIIAIGVLLVLGNLWVSTATLARDQVVINGQTVFEFLQTKPQTGVVQTDQVYYNNILFHLRAGEPYYKALQSAYHENALWGIDPPSVIAVREPLLPEFLAHLPGGARSIIWAMALLASIAAFSALWIARDIAEPGVRLISVIAVSAYFLGFTTLPFVLGFEPWGGALSVVSAALFATSLDAASERSRRGFMLGAVAVAVLAVAIRELMIFVPLAGLAAAFLAEKPRRRFDAIAWGSGVAATVAIWGVHAWLARSIVTPSAALGRAIVFGGIGNVLAAFRHGALYISGSEAVLVGLGVLGIVGAFAQRDRQYRIFLVLCTVVPLIAFFFAWNRAIDEATKRQINYWGAVMAPLAFALVPAALGLIPGMRRAASDSQGGDVEATSAVAG